MGPEDAISLLLTIVHIHGGSAKSYVEDKILVGRVASELGYLPLVLTHAGETIRRNIYPLDKYPHYFLSYRK